MARVGGGGGGVGSGVGGGERGVGGGGRVCESPGFWGSTLVSPSQNTKDFQLFSESMDIFGEPFSSSMGGGRGGGRGGTPMSMTLSPAPGVVSGQKRKRAKKERGEDASVYLMPPSQGCGGRGGGGGGGE